MIPLYGFMSGDTCGVLVLAQSDDTIAEIATKLQQAARLRVASLPHYKVIYNNRTLSPNSTVSQCEMQALERFDVVPNDN